MSRLGQRMHTIFPIMAEHPRFGKFESKSAHEWRMKIQAILGGNTLAALHPASCNERNGEHDLSDSCGLTSFPDVVSPTCRFVRLSILDRETSNFFLRGHFGMQGQQFATLWN